MHIINSKADETLNVKQLFWAVQISNKPSRDMSHMNFFYVHVTQLCPRGFLNGTFAWPKYSMYNSGNSSDFHAAHDFGVWYDIFFNNFFHK